MGGFGTRLRAERIAADQKADSEEKGEDAHPPIRPRIARGLQWIKRGQSVPSASISQDGDHDGAVNDGPLGCNITR
jgi:hypothetical protein